jgi:[acyl-carrier-protein] S-malonyltransferase
MTVEEALELVRERGIAMAEAAARHRLDGGDPRARGRGRDALPQDPRLWPTNYNCPGQIVVSERNDAVDECCERAQEEGARRAVKLKVSGAFHSPLVARAADRLPAIEGELKAAVAVHVDRDRPRRVGTADGPAPRRPAHRAGPLHPGGERADEGGRAHTFVEVGPGNVLSGSSSGSTAA